MLESPKLININTSDFELFSLVSPPVTTDTEAKLAKFKRLPQGWNFGRGVSIKDDVFDIAVDLLRYINQLGISKTDAFPGTDGDVCLGAYRFSHYIEASIEVDLTITVSYEMGADEVFSKEGLSVREAKKELREAVKLIWGSSALFTRATMIELDTDLTTWLSKNSSA